MGEKLLPCPFCGVSEDMLTQAYYADRANSYPNYVKCEACGAEVIGASKEAAIAAWNTRAPADLRSALEAIANTGEGWGTSGDGHAKCIQIARAALAPTKEPAA